MATPTVINLSDVNPPAPSGRINAQFLASTPYSLTVVVNGQAVTVAARDVSASLPLPGSSGTSAVVTLVPLAPVSAGNFTVAHGAPGTPVFVLIQMTDSGSIYLQSPLAFDATNLYLTASAGGITGTAYVWISPPDEINAFTSSAGNFTVAHTLGTTPALVLIEFDSGGAVWFQSPTSWDGFNVYLVGGIAGVTGRVILWKKVPSIVVVTFTEISLAPVAPGNFTVAHGLGQTPTVVMIRMTDSGAIWVQAPADAANLYLAASAGGITGKADVWANS